MEKITSANNPLIKRLVKLRQDRQLRYEGKSVVIEGIKMIREVAQHTPLKALFCTQEPPPEIYARQIFIVPEHVMQKISGTKNPEGIVAEVEMPPEGTLEGKQKVIAFDQLNDPGNVGTLIRTALALGWEGVYLIDNCCDPYNEKALRAARGATFRLPIRWGSWEELTQLAAQNDWALLAADISGNTLEEISPTKNILLVLGNEAQGISEETRHHCQTVTIPMAGEMESLNVATAGAILMYTLRVK